jgi:hypothetical protein
LTQPGDFDHQEAVVGRIGCEAGGAMPTYVDVNPWCAHAQSREPQEAGEVDLALAPRKPTVPRAVLSAAELQLFVSDITASCEFFTTKLGFVVVHVYGDPPFHGHVSRDGAALNPRAVSTGP